ncbi:MAG TPA: hypothetical protein VNL71_02235 [Chloroflexota bacterium]|nr:hypothetical protein [Chloroflexota bacterium]
MPTKQTGEIDQVIARAARIRSEATDLGAHPHPEARSQADFAAAWASLVLSYAALANPLARLTADLAIAEEYLARAITDPTPTPPD